MVTQVNEGNYFGFTLDRPYHLSIGGIILDREHNVYCLHYPKIDELKDIFVLPNKTLRKEETLEAALRRGMRAEIGCEIELVTFLGILNTQDTWCGESGNPTAMEKSVVYFLAKEIAHNPKLAQEENEKQHREISIQSIPFLIEKMEHLQVKDGMRDFNQAKILLRAQEWIASHPDLASPTL